MSSFRAPAPDARNVATVGANAATDFNADVVAADVNNNIIAAVVNPFFFFFFFFLNGPPSTITNSIQ